MKITVLAATSLLVCLGVAVPASRAQGQCSLKTMVGTYAIEERGTSAIVDLTSAPYPGYWNAAIAPFAAVGEITFKADGIGTGYYWLRHGSINSGIDSIPVTVTITQLDADCTGKFTYEVNLPGVTPPPMIEERLIVFDNGREFRSIPISVSTSGDPNVAWVGIGQRIGKPGEPVNFCGPQTAHGTYLISSDNLVNPPNQSVITVGDTLLLDIKISMAGDYTGTLYEKLGPRAIQLPITGMFDVNPDCSFTGTINVQGLTGTAYVRGVFYDEGRSLFALTEPKTGEATRTMYSVSQGVRTGE